MTVGKAPLPVGKLPLPLLEKLLRSIPSGDPNILAGPGIGVDAAVVRFGDQTLVFKTDPITFTSENISRYLVTVNSNDIACMGGIPRYLLVTFLLPAGPTTPASVEELFSDLKQACAAMDVTLIGGHTEITHGIERPLATGFMIGVMEEGMPHRPRAAKAGDLILLSKQIPIEAVSVIASEAPRRLDIDGQTLAEARSLIRDPGISIFKEARIAWGHGGVTAMHDPTEGGLATGLRELALASGCGVEVYQDRIAVLPIAEKILPLFGIDPLGALASGSLVVCCEEHRAEGIIAAWAENGIEGSIIGRLTEARDMVLVRDGARTDLPEFPVDEVTKIFSLRER
jgi:hydrogenase maturation factor